MTCTHRTPPRLVYRDVEVSPYGDTETQLVDEGSQMTYEDVSVGAFRCTQCGEVGYYTGLWKRFYENGEPCPGSDGVSRALPPFTPQVKP